MNRWMRIVAMCAPTLLMAGPLAAQQASPSTTAAPAEVSRDGTLAVTSAVQETAIGQDLPVNSGEFQRRLLTNEEEVNRLKEKVFRSKATLQLLQEVVLQGASAGAHATLVHSSILGNTYTIESVNYYLDGQSIYSKVFERGADAGTKEFKVHDGAIPAGNHTVSLSMVLRGSGYGVFSYVDRYTFNVQSSYTFTVDEGKTCVVRVRTKERKGIGRSFVERPTVEYDMSCTRMDQGK